MRFPKRFAVFMVLLVIALSVAVLAQSKLLIPMDLKQTDHLKSYGVAFWVLQHNGEVDWLLNYRGGSFMTDYSDVVARECRVRGVLFEALGAGEASSIFAEVQRDNNNMDVVRLEKAPKIAVYVPPNFKPWDDAVTLAL
ncbi:MAG: asparagine synthetase B, partial [Bacteroidota bacterium]